MKKSVANILRSEENRYYNRSELPRTVSIMNNVCCGLHRSDIKTAYLSTQGRVRKAQFTLNPCLF